MRLVWWRSDPAKEEPMAGTLERQLAEVVAGTGGSLATALTSAISIVAEDQPRVFTRTRYLAAETTVTACREAFAIDLAGVAETGGDGKATWRLGDSTCASEIPPIVEPPGCFVATPIAEAPVVLTTSIKWQNPPDDLVVEVYTWDLGGLRLPHVTFSWRCRVGYEVPIP
jgi:hypothetical protein